MSLNLFTDEEIEQLVKKAGFANFDGLATIQKRFKEFANAAIEMKMGVPIAWMVTSNEKSHGEFRELAFHEPHKRSDWDVTGLYAIQSTKE